jgi:hypothetical protein
MDETVLSRGVVIRGQILKEAEDSGRVFLLERGLPEVRVQFGWCLQGLRDATSDPLSVP